jgi:hypothetical protein
LAPNASWELISDAPEENGAFYRLILPADQGSKYYRLSK